LGFLKDSFRIPSGILRDSFMIPSGFLQDPFRILSEFLQDPFRIPSGFLQDSFRIQEGSATCANSLRIPYKLLIELFPDFFIYAVRILEDFSMLYPVTAQMKFGYNYNTWLCYKEAVLRRGLCHILYARHSM